MTEPFQLAIPYKVARARDGGGGGIVPSHSTALSRDPGRLCAELSGLYPVTDAYGLGGPARRFPVAAPAAAASSPTRTSAPIVADASQSSSRPRARPQQQRKEGGGDDSCLPRVSLAASSNAVTAATAASIFADASSDTAAATSSSSAAVVAAAAAAAAAASVAPPTSHAASTSSAATTPAAPGTFPHSVRAALMTWRRYGPTHARGAAVTAGAVAGPTSASGSAHSRHPRTSAASVGAASSPGNRDNTLATTFATDAAPATSNGAHSNTTNGSATGASRTPRAAPSHDIVAGTSNGSLLSTLTTPLCAHDRGVLLTDAIGAGGPLASAMTAGTDTGWAIIDFAGRLDVEFESQWRVTGPEGTRTTTRLLSTGRTTISVCGPTLSHSTASAPLLLEVPSGLALTQRTQYPASGRGVWTTATEVELPAPRISVLYAGVEAAMDLIADWGTAGNVPHAEVPWLHPAAVARLNACPELSFRPSVSTLCVRASSATLRLNLNDGNVIDGSPWDPLSSTHAVLRVPAFSIGTLSPYIHPRASHVATRFAMCMSAAAAHARDPLVGPSVGVGAGAAGVAAVAGSERHASSSSDSSPSINELGSAATGAPSFASISNSAFSTAAIATSAPATAVAASNVEVLIYATKSDDVRPADRVEPTENAATAPPSLAPPTQQSHASIHHGRRDVPNARSATYVLQSYPPTAFSSIDIPDTLWSYTLMLCDSLRNATGSGSGGATGSDSVCNNDYTAGAGSDIQRRNTGLLFDYALIPPRPPGVDAATNDVAHAVFPRVPIETATADCTLDTDSGDRRSEHHQPRLRRHHQSPAVAAAAGVVEAYLSLPPRHPRSRMGAADPHIHRLRGTAARLFFSPGSHGATFCDARGPDGARGCSDFDDGPVMVGPVCVQRILSLSSLSLGGTRSSCLRYPLPVADTLEAESTAACMWNAVQAADWVAGGAANPTPAQALPHVKTTAAAQATPRADTTSASSTPSSSSAAALSPPPPPSLPAIMRDRLSFDVLAHGPTMLTCSPEAIAALSNLNDNYAGVSAWPVTSQEWLRDGCRNIRSALRARNFIAYKSPSSHASTHCAPSSSNSRSSSSSISSGATSADAIGHSPLPHREATRSAVPHTHPLQLPQQTYGERASTAVPRGPSTRLGVASGEAGSGTAAGVGVAGPVSAHVRFAATGDSTHAGRQYVESSDSSSDRAATVRFLSSSLHSPRGGAPSNAGNSGSGAAYPVVAGTPPLSTMPPSAFPLSGDARLPQGVLLAPRYSPWAELETSMRFTTTGALVLRIPVAGDGVLLPQATCDITRGACATSTHPRVEANSSVSSLLATSTWSSASWASMRLPPLCLVSRTAPSVLDMSVVLPAPITLHAPPDRVSSSSRSASASSANVTQLQQLRRPGRASSSVQQAPVRDGPSVTPSTPPSDSDDALTHGRVLVTVSSLSVRLHCLYCALGSVLHFQQPEVTGRIANFASAAQRGEQRQLQQCDASVNAVDSPSACESHGASLPPDRQHDDDNPRSDNSSAATHSTPVLAGESVSTSQTLHTPALVSDECGATGSVSAGASMSLMPRFNVPPVPTTPSAWLGPPVCYASSWDFDVGDVSLNASVGTTSSCVSAVAASAARSNGNIRVNTGDDRVRTTDTSARANDSHGRSSDTSAVDRVPTHAVLSHMQPVPFNDVASLLILAEAWQRGWAAVKASPIGPLHTITQLPPRAVTPSSPGSAPAAIHATSTIRSLSSPIGVLHVVIHRAAMLPALGLRKGRRKNANHPLIGYQIELGKSLLVLPPALVAHRRVDAHVPSSTASLTSSCMPAGYVDAAAAAAAAAAHASGGPARHIAAARTSARAPSGGGVFDADSVSPALRRGIAYFYSPPMPQPHDVRSTHGSNSSSSKNAATEYSSSPTTAAARATITPPIARQSRAQAKSPRPGITGASLPYHNRDSQQFDIGSSSSYPRIYPQFNAEDTEDGVEGRGGRELRRASRAEDEAMPPLDEDNDAGSGSVGTNSGGDESVSPRDGGDSTRVSTRGRRSPRVGTPRKHTSASPSPAANTSVGTHSIASVDPHVGYAPHSHSGNPATAAGLPPVSVDNASTTSAHRGASSIAALLHHFRGRVAVPFSGSSGSGGSATATGASSDRTHGTHDATAAVSSTAASSTSGSPPATAHGFPVFTARSIPSASHASLSVASAQTKSRHTLPYYYSSAPSASAVSASAAPLHPPTSTATAGATSAPASHYTARRVRSATKNTYAIDATAASTAADAAVPAAGTAPTASDGIAASSAPPAPPTHLLLAHRAKLKLPAEYLGPDPLRWQPFSWSSVAGKSSRRAGGGSGGAVVSAAAPVPGGVASVVATAGGGAAISSRGPMGIAAADSAYTSTAAAGSSPSHANTPLLQQQPQTVFEYMGVPLSSRDVIVAPSSPPTVASPTAVPPMHSRRYVSSAATTAAAAPTPASASSSLIAPSDIDYHAVHAHAHVHAHTAVEMPSRASLLRPSQVILHAPPQATDVFTASTTAVSHATPASGSPLFQPQQRQQLPHLATAVAVGPVSSLSASASAVVASGMMALFAGISAEAVEDAGGGIGTRLANSTGDDPDAVVIRINEHNVRTSGAAGAANEAKLGDRSSSSSAASGSSSGRGSSAVTRTSSGRLRQQQLQQRGVAFSVGPDVRYNSRTARAAYDGGSGDASIIRTSQYSSMANSDGRSNAGSAVAASSPASPDIYSAKPAPARPLGTATTPLPSSSSSSYLSALERSLLPPIPIPPLAQ